MQKFRIRVTKRRPVTQYSRMCYLYAYIHYTLLLLLLLLNVFDDAPVCRHVKDESWARAVSYTHLTLPTIYSV